MDTNTNRALVRFSHDAGERRGMQSSEVFNLKPTTLDIAEVERQWKLANDGKDRTFIDATLLPVESAPEPARPAPARTEETAPVVTSEDTSPPAAAKRAK